MMVIGLDPGVNTGAGVFEDGKLIELLSIAPHEVASLLSRYAPDRIIFEDSRLISHVWTGVKSRPAALKMARNVGEIDGQCRYITAVCADMGIPCHGVSPKTKGAKVKAEMFNKLTGWTGKSNEHQRDGAMVAYPYRRAAK